MMPDSPTTKSLDFPLEEALERLEAIVDSMESDTLPLALMLKSYEEGSRLLKRCQEMIAQAQSRIEMINLDDSAGAATEPFEPPPAAPGPASPAASARKRKKSGGGELELSAEEGDEIRLF